jgi:hypothetical protein
MPGSIPRNKGDPTALQLNTKQKNWNGIENLMHLNHVKLFFSSCVDRET